LHCDANKAVQLGSAFWYFILMWNLFFFAGMAVRISALFLVMVMLVRLSQIEAIAVMSVDLGSEWMKIAIVSVISVSTCAARVLDSAYTFSK